MTVYFNTNSELLLRNLCFLLFWLHLRIAHKDQSDGHNCHKHMPYKNNWYTCIVRTPYDKPLPADRAFARPSDHQTDIMNVNVHKFLPIRSTTRTKLNTLFSRHHFLTIMQHAKRGLRFRMSESVFNFCVSSSLPPFSPLSSSFNIYFSPTHWTTNRISSRA
jgi:hypothetical protein